MIMITKYIHEPECVGFYQENIALTFEYDLVWHVYLESTLLHLHIHWYIVEKHYSALRK